MYLAQKCIIFRIFEEEEKIITFLPTYVSNCF